MSKQLMKWRCTQVIKSRPSELERRSTQSPPRNVKEVQKLTGSYLSRLTNFVRSTTSYGKNKEFLWTEKHEKSLQDLKQYMASPPLLSKPKEHVMLQLYLAVSASSLSLILAREDDNQHLPAYYISKSLLDAEIRYSALEKLVLALTTTVKKLQHYIETHPVVVRTNFPLKSVLRSQNLTGRLGKWCDTLSGYNIKYQIRMAIKSQALANFVAVLDVLTDVLAEVAPGGVAGDGVEDVATKDV
uniref:Reverse transcriptase/retrotransposon-derived protein RNase H-like domain-containing protein n=1 Tax=Chenopodium quinoa TaxID=63459 RepID=A0A803NAN2_CHEQI